MHYEGTRSLSRQPMLAQHRGCVLTARPSESDEQVLGADAAMPHQPRLLLGACHDAPRLLCEALQHARQHDANDDPSPSASGQPAATRLRLVEAREAFADPARDPVALSIRIPPGCCPRRPGARVTGTPLSDSTVPDSFR